MSCQTGLKCPDNIASILISRYWYCQDQNRTFTCKVILIHREILRSDLFLVRKTIVHLWLCICIIAEDYYITDIQIFGLVSILFLCFLFSFCLIALFNVTICEDSKIQQTKIAVTKIQLSLLITKHIIQVGSKFITAASKQL